MKDRRISLEVDITNISDHGRRERIGAAMKQAWRLEDAASALVANLDLTTMQFFVINPEAHKALAQIQNIVAELRKS